MSPTFFLITALSVGGCRDGREGELAACGFAERPVAMFEVLQEQTDSGWTLHVSGWVGDGPWPTFHQVEREDESCRALSYEGGLCEPDCGLEELCVSGSCVGWPEGLSAGTATLRVAGETTRIEHEDAWAGRYWGSMELAAEAWGEGHELSLALDGDAFPAVELFARGVLPLDSEVEERGLWVEDEPVTLGWNAGDDEGACVHVNLYTSSVGHGRPVRDVVECVAADTGRLTIPASITELFPSWNTPGVCAGGDCPDSELIRATRGVASTQAGDTWLTVYHEIEFALEAEETDYGW